jgi:hypothetical protein
MKTYTNIFGKSVKASVPTMAKRDSSPAATKGGKVKKKVKGKKGKAEEKPAKKKGRPSNEELRQRAAEKRAADLEVRKALLQRQEAAEKLGTQSLPVEVEEDVDEILTLRQDVPVASVRDPNWIPPWPVFLPGARVQATYDGILYTGTVYSDDVELPTIRVKWDDGSSQHAAKKNLTRERKKFYINVYKA